MALLPEDSTDLPDNDGASGTGDDGSGGEMETSTPDIQMDSEQMQSAGLSGAQPGEEYTLKITVTNTDEGLTASVVPGSATKAQNDLAPMPKGGKQNVKGPGDMGFGAGDGFDQPSPL